MKKMSSFCLGLLGMVALSLVCPQQAKALDSQYLRNGECYLLIGEGEETLRGVYRLNNPVANKCYDPPKQVIKGKDIKNTLGFNVDLYRNIYTFTEVVDSKFKLAEGNLIRQVVDDGATADHSDYGYHSYIHADHRSWGKKTNLYRTSRKDGNIKSSGGTWGDFKSAGPGTKVKKPNGYKLPDMGPDSDDAAKSEEYDGKSWYEIPNGSWYSTWKQGTCQKKKAFSNFYMVFGDKLEVKKHDYKLWTWTPKNAEVDQPKYTKDTGNTVAKTQEEKFTREVLAGCLDGCGSASGNGSVEPKPMHNDIAFQPPVKDQPKRTYFYTRTEGTSSYKVTKDNSTYPSKNIIGKPASEDTYWLSISLKDTTSDYVYCLGTSAINEWYKQVYGSYQSNMNISAVTASNQWDQEGGIVYAYDKGNKKIYKFERKETTGTPISKERFLSIDVASITSIIGAIDNSEFDDIKADGFGSLYLALSHPSKKTSDYNPVKHFVPSDCIHLHPTTHDAKKGEQDFVMIFKQDYGKKVFERNYLDGKIKLIGSKNYATIYYNISCKIKDAGWNIIKNYPGGCSFSTFNNTLATYSATINGNTYNKATTKWSSSWYKKGLGACNCYEELSYTDPGHAKLAVINVPTPPRVISLGNKKSYLDIVGPYVPPLPAYDKENRTTNQRDGLLKLSNLNVDEIYYYMVENYPLEDGAQDPTTQLDMDEDSRQGGFITSIQDPAPYSSKVSSHPNGVRYEWKTWMVMDLYGNCVCRLSQKVDEKDGTYYNHIYSPVAGKFIMTCRVKYNWYDYDALPFGSTVNDLKDVLHTNEFAVPVSTDGISAEWASDRLTQIKNSFKYKGPNTKNKEIDFMNHPINQDGKSIDVDYSPIVSDANGGKYLALIPISVGNIGSMPPPPSVVFPITRCDDIPNVATSSYMNNDSFWSKVPSDDKTFGIAAGEVYNWRIDKTAQEYMFKDISKYNNTNSRDKNYNYLAHQMITPGSDFFVNKKANFKFKNDLGDLRWSDKKIMVSAKLIYKVPDGAGYKEIAIALKQALDNSSSVGSDYEFEYDVKDETTLWDKNTPIYFTTAGDLPPTDPMDARIQITMRRQYNYDMWAYDKDSQPSFQVSNLPGWFKVTGEAKIRIIDTTKPAVVWEKTVPNNLFGYTGGELKQGVGPKGKANPSNINFTVRDNNPWEAVETQNGLSLDNHITNINYNYGGAYCREYCSKNSYLEERYNYLKPSSVTGIKNEIDSRKKSIQPTSSYNYKPLFSRQARDVRFAFETVRRDLITGYVKLDKADSLYNTTSRRQFNSDSNSDYAVHYRDGKRHNEKYQQSLVLENMQYVRKVGSTDVYDSTLVYKMPVSSIKIGTNDTGSSLNRIPDSYANNTPGYRDEARNIIRPYKFYVSLTDSSGNYTGQKELNMVLNVRDDIPPVGYGSVYDSKYERYSYFPYEGEVKDFSDNPVNAPSNRIKGEYYYFSQALSDKFLRGSNWASNEENGFVKSNGVNGPYKAVIPMGDKIAASTKSNSLKDNKIFMQHVRNKISPQAVEDNVECKFNVYVSDNCGGANATLSINYFDNNGYSDSQPEITKSITSSWTSSADTGIWNVKNIASTTKELHTLFRGSSGQFPMAIPIKIVSEDDARDWDYYNECNVDNGNWSWGTIHYGLPAKNIRTFKTSLPVFGSELDIRTLDKTIQNH